MRDLFTIVNPSKLRNAEHMQQHREIAVLVVGGVKVGEIIPDGLRNAYLEAVEYEQESFNILRKSKFTTDLDALDRERDLIFRGLVHTVKGSQTHFDPARRDAARRIGEILGGYGNISTMALNAESANIIDLYAELTSPQMLSYVELLGIKEWLDKLLEISQAYSLARQERVEEEVSNTKYNMRTARLETDRVFRLLLNYIEIILATAPNPVMENLAGEINVILKQYQREASLEHAVNGNPPEGGETIVEQREDDELIIER